MRGSWLETTISLTARLPLLSHRSESEGEKGS
jgi:hypothetical protein